MYKLPIGDDGRDDIPLTPLIKTWRKKNAREEKGLKGSPIGEDGPFNKCTDRLSAMTEGGYPPNPPYQNMEKKTRERGKGWKDRLSAMTAHSISVQIAYRR